MHEECCTHQGWSAGTCPRYLRSRRDGPPGGIGGPRRDARITMQQGKGDPMKRIVLAQQKGGAAKTTLCVHLAVAAQQAGFKTAIIDTDPQGSASAVWGTARGDTA